MDKRCGNCEWYIHVSHSFGGCDDPTKKVYNADSGVLHETSLAVSIDLVCDNHKPTDFSKWAEFNTPRDV